MIHTVIEGHKEIVELLLRQEGIDINIKDILNHKHSRYSELTFFMKLKFWMIYGILKVNIYKAAISYAREKNYQDIVDLLSRGISGECWYFIT